MPILSDIPPAVWETLVSSGTPSILMACAVWWLQKGNQSLVMELNKERSERIDTLEAHVVNCDKDRSELRTMLLKHLGVDSPH